VSQTAQKNNIMCSVWPIIVYVFLSCILSESSQRNNLNKNGITSPLQPVVRLSNFRKLQHDDFIDFLYAIDAASPFELCWQSNTRRIFAIHRKPSQRLFGAKRVWTRPRVFRKLNAFSKIKGKKYLIILSNFVSSK
jgi:hypothetical protein